MRPQRITRIVNAAASQNRYIVWLECQHKVSLTLLQVKSMPNYKIGDAMDCPFCPDPTLVEVRQETSARALWKEAGEP